MSPKMNTDLSQKLEIIKKPKIMAGIAGGLVVTLIWLFAFILPANTKVDNYNAQAQTLQTTYAGLQAQVAALQKISNLSPALLAEQSKLQALIPPATNLTANLQWIKSIYTTATATGVTMLGHGALNAPSASPTSSIALLSVPISTTSTYDQALAFMKAIYALPRLTTIQSVSINGGGLGTSRSTILTIGYTLNIYVNEAAG